MPMSSSELFLRVALALHTLKQDPDIAAAAGISAHALETGSELWNRALFTIEHLIERRDDFTAFNQVFRSMAEVESWYGAIVAAITQAHGESLPYDWADITGQSVQGPTDAFTISMRVLRLVSALRTRPELWSRLQHARPRLADDLQRGHTLMIKALKLLDKLYQIRNPAPAEAQHMSELVYRRDQLTPWYEAFCNHAEKHLSSRAPVLGLLGIIPEGAGVPFGGTAFDVLRHRKAQTEVSDTTPSPPCPGWGTGTSANRENYWQKR